MGFQLVAKSLNLKRSQLVQLDTADAGYGEGLDCIRIQGPSCPLYISDDAVYGVSGLLGRLNEAARRHRRLPRPSR